MKISEIFMDAEYEIRLKAPVLYRLNLIMIVLLIILEIMELVHGDLPIQVAFPLIIVGLLISLFSLKKGNYTGASRITSYTIFTMVFLIFLIDGYTGDQLVTQHLFASFFALFLVTFFIGSIRVTINLTILAIMGFVGRLTFLMLTGLAPWTIGVLLNMITVPMVLFLGSFGLMLLWKRVGDKIYSDSQKRYEWLEAQSEKNGLLLRASAEQFSRIQKLEEYSEQTAAAAIEIEKNTESIGKQISSLKAGSQASQESLNGIINSIQGLTKTSDEQSETVAESSASIEEMVTSIKSVSHIIHSKKRAVETLSKTAQGGEKVLKQTSDSFEQVIDKIESIKKMTSIIGAIAGQTNLLAMNAAIEAAHAGEAGKGFAVVADEVRKLAESSSKNAKEIGGVIKELINAIEQSGYNITETSSSFHEISKEISAVSTAMDEIYTSTGELSVGSEEILKGTARMNDYNSRVTTWVSQVSHDQKIISTNIMEVSQVVDTVVFGVVEIKAGTTDIRNSLEELREMTEGLLAYSDKLNKSFHSN